MDMQAAADYLTDYGCGGVWDDTHFGIESREVHLQNFRIHIGEGAVGIALTYNGFQHMASDGSGVA